MRLLRVSVLLFLLFGLSFAYFTQEDGNANVICRAGLVANVVQHGRIDIDEYQKWTVDKANFNGTYYCDKAPGQSFLAVPAAFAFTRMLPIAGSTIASNNRTWSAFVYACAVSTSGLISALGAVLCFRFLYARTRRSGAGLVGSIAFALGTPVWGWATSFFSHATAASLLLMGLVALDWAAGEIRRGERAIGLGVLAGLAFGAATIVEYTSVLPALLIGAAIAPLAFSGEGGRPGVRGNGGRGTRDARARARLPSCGVRIAVQLALRARSRLRGDTNGFFRHP